MGALSGDYVTILTNRGIRRAASSGAILLAAALSGCASQQMEPVPAAAPVSGTPRNTGEYPNLNIPPKSAAPQLTEEEAAAKLAELEAAKAGQGAGVPASDNRAVRLKKIAEEHAEETLEEIEGQ